MSSAIAFAPEEALTEETAVSCDLGIGELLAATVLPVQEVPCRSHDADLWFAEKPAQLEQAKQLCAVCPVRTLCLAGALAREEPWGVWGGEILERGTIVAMKRPRGRPRKTGSASTI